MNLKVFILAISTTLFALNANCFEYANAKKSTNENPEPPILIKAKAPIKKLAEPANEEAEISEEISETEKSSPTRDESETLIQELTDKYTAAESTLQKYKVLKQFAQNSDKLPKKIEIEDDVIYLNKASKECEFVITKAGAYPQILIPRKHTKLAIPSVYKIKRTYDRNRNANLEDEELISIMLELRMKFDEAQTESERQEVLNRYGEIFAKLNKEEMEVSWGNNSKFRIERNIDNGTWSAPDEAPIKKYAANEHPSYKFVDELSEVSDLAVYEMLKELSLANPQDRPALIVKLLPKYLKADYPTQDSKEFENRKLLSQSGFESFIEAKNISEESVLVPVFITDPENTVQILSTTLLPTK